jgi:hypothetical protein
MEDYNLCNVCGDAVRYGERHSTCGKKELKESLVVGAKIKLGEGYCKNRNCTAGEVITLVEGIFDRENGLYCTTETAPAIWDEKAGDFDSIYHLFGNDLEDFEDCEILDA